MIQKFRVWDKQTETIQEIESISFKERKLVIAQQSIAWFNADYIRNFDDIELMKSTGLRDKTYEKEIYSDQILLVDGEKGKFKAKVIYECGAFGIVAVKGRIIDYFPDNWNDDFMTLLDLYWNYNNDDNCIDQVEVVGNIYENSELLEVK